MILIWNLNKENDAYTIVGEIHLFLGANVHACMHACRGFSWEKKETYLT